MSALQIFATEKEISRILNDFAIKRNMMGAAKETGNMSSQSAGRVVRCF